MNNFRKRYSKLKKNGFSIAEVLVGLALIGIIAAAIIGVVTNVMKTQRGVQAKDHQRELTSIIRSFLANPTACTNTFVGRNPVPQATVTALKDALGADRYTLVNDSTGLLKFEEFKITNWISDAGFPTRGSVEFRIKFLRLGETGTAPELKPDIITLKAKVDGSGNLTECYSIGSQADSLWQKSLIVTSDIYYNAGNVGIGVIAPTKKFEVFDSSTAAAYRRSVAFIGSYEPLAANTNDLWFADFQAQYNSLVNSDRIIGGHFDSHIQSSGSLARAQGLVGKSSTELTSSGSITTAVGIYGLIDHYGTGTITDASAIWATVVAWPGSGPVNTGYGIQIGEINALNKFGVYQSDAAARNYFSGDIGVGITLPTTKLQVAGVISPSITNTYSLGTSGLAFSTVYTTTGTVTASDARLKKDISDVDLGLNFINKLRPVSYRWKNGSDDKIHYGLLAQETEKVLADSRNKIIVGTASLVDYDIQSDKYGIRYSELIAPLIKAVQQLHKLIQNFQAKHDMLNEQLNADIKNKDLQIKNLQEENFRIKEFLCQKNSNASFCRQFRN